MSKTIKTGMSLVIFGAGSLFGLLLLGISWTFAQYLMSKASFEEKMGMVSLLIIVIGVIIIGIGAWQEDNEE